MSRVVVVTGASRGIGAATAEAFISLGDSVIAISRSGTAPEGAAKSFALDVTDSTVLKSVFDEIVQEFGPIEVLVANAGITRDGLAFRMSSEQWREVLAVNLDGSFYSAQAAMGSMIRNRRGSIIFIGSVSPFMGIPGQANYAAAKAGLVGLSRSLATELARRNITVNVVAPGFIDTEMTAELGMGLDALLPQIPAGRIGQPEEIAQVVVFLASE
ncbi:MAG: SDR family NAD(P)-dependent oxidoreductase, partial [Actinomycetes bacterium]